MDIWGWVVSKIIEVKEDICEKATCVAENCREIVTNMWNLFSGRDKFEEAEFCYEQIVNRYNSRRRRFENDVEDYTNKIEKHVEVINHSKERIKKELFCEMAKKMEYIKDITIAEDFSVEEYMASVLSFDNVNEKSNLYKIDFNKHKFRTTIQAIFTLGFYTRKKATETLYAVQEEGKKIDVEIAKMDAEIVKLRAIEQSLENIEYYFTSLIELYENLLVRLDSSVNYLYVRCMSLAHKMIHTEMSIRRLSRIQQKEVEAIITASKILKEMTETQLISLENQEQVNSYSQKMKHQHEEMNKVYKAA